jgi:hypothetical protein
MSRIHCAGCNVRSDTHPVKYKLPSRPPGAAPLGVNSGKVCQKCYDDYKSSAVATRKELQERPGLTRHQQAATAAFLRDTEAKGHPGPRLHADSRLVAGAGAVGIDADADMDDAHAGDLLESDADMVAVQPEQQRQQPEDMVTDMQDAAHQHGPTEEPAPHERVSELFWSKI